jgi:glycosyltransferase involved in cell wall biosynthesis
MRATTNSSPYSALRIALIGPYPPPYGGISNHISRLEAGLRELGHKVDIYPNRTVRGWLFTARGKWLNYDVLHFHDIGWKYRTVVGLLGFAGLKTILTIHGGSLKSQLNTLRGLRLKLFRFGLRHIKHIISVYPEARQLLLSIGVDESHTSVINSYLPPEKSIGDLTGLPADIQEFAASHKPLLAANGFETIPWGEQDLYGIGMCIDLCKALITDYPELGFVFSLSRPGDNSLLEAYKVRITQHHLQNNFKFVFGQPFTPLLAHARVFLRPTFQDGYGISVAEALYSGVPAIASDVCPRTPGTILFEAGNQADFLHKTHEVLDDYTDIQEKIARLEMPNTLPELIKVYQQVAS